MNCLYFDLVVRFIKTFLIICLMMIALNNSAKLSDSYFMTHRRFISNVLTSEILWDFCVYLCCFSCSFSSLAIFLPCSCFFLFVSFSDKIDIKTCTFKYHTDMYFFYGKNFSPPPYSECSEKNEFYRMIHSILALFLFVSLSPIRTVIIITFRFPWIRASR